MASSSDPNRRASTLSALAADGLVAKFDWNAWALPPVFGWPVLAIARIAWSRRPAWVSWRAHRCPLHRRDLDLDRIRGGRPPRAGHRAWSESCSREDAGSSETAPPARDGRRCPGKRGMRKQEQRVSDGFADRFGSQKTHQRAPPGKGLHRNGVSERKAERSDFGWAWAVPEGAGLQRQRLRRKTGSNRAFLSDRSAGSCSR